MRNAIQSVILVLLLVALVAPSCGKRAARGHNDVPPAGVAVSQAEYGAAWPFTVTSGYVDCVPPQSAVFRTGSSAYALNGMAKSRGFPDVRPIWRDNPSLPGTKINIGPMIDLALQQCR